jgi:aspartate/glutamate racemase
MKVAGIIGGIAPESTIEYYRLILAAYRERLGDGHYPAVLINSIDMQKMLGLIAAEALSALTEYLLRENDKLARRGCGVRVAGFQHAACGVCGVAAASSTPSAQPRRSGLCRHPG